MNAPFECIYYNEIRSHNSTADILKTKIRWQIHYQGKKNTYTNKHLQTRERSSKNKEQKFKYSNKRSKAIRINKPQRNKKKKFKYKNR